MFFFVGLILLLIQLFLKLLNGMARSIDTDQAAPSSDQCLHYLSETLVHEISVHLA